LTLGTRRLSAPGSACGSWPSFVSDEAAFVTGVALDFDGGAHLGFMPGT
jgi:hypothetical protein